MSDKASVSTNDSAFSFLKSIKFILISYLISFLLIAVLSAVITWTDVPEAVASPSVRVITFFSAFLSALLTTRSSGSKGWLVGALTGAINIAVLLLFGMALFGGMAFSFSNALMILLGAVSGMAGGIIGVNL